MACTDCFKGFLRTDKQPTGTEATIYGLPTYVSHPPTDSLAKGIIVFVPDAYGWEFINNRLLCDTYAASGFRVYLPDFMEGVSSPVYLLPILDRLTSMSSFRDWIYKPYDIFWFVYGLVPFFWRNMPNTSHPRVTKFLERIRTAPTVEDKGLKVGVAGFCWGGKHVIMLTHKDEAHLIDSVFTAHPSALNLPSDIDNVHKSVSVAVGSKDNWLSPEQVVQVQKTLRKLENEVDGMRSEVVVYPGASHGFSVRIDFRNAEQLEQSQQAERQAIQWFERTLR